MAPPVEKKKKHSSADHRLISSAAIGEREQQPMGSLVASNKMKRPLRKIWICTDVLMDILPFFHHAQLGLKMALISPRFDVLVDTHFDGKSELTLWRPMTIQKDNGMPQLFVMGKSVPFPLPDRPLPNKIRFEELQIIYIDHSVLAFLRANQQIWDKSGTKLSLIVSAIDKDFAQSLWKMFIREIWPIFATNIRHLTFCTAEHLDNFRRHISPTILTDLDQLDSIEFYFLYPDVISDDGPNATAGQALSKWLHTPRKDGQPKRLICRHYDYRSMPTLNPTMRRG